MITMTVMLPRRWFADRFGNKRIYILGLALFTLGSWLCGKAPGDLFLIGARALQGVGSGIIQSLGLAIVTREFPPQQRGLALGLWSVAAAASISFGPLIGGYLVDDYSRHLSSMSMFLWDWRPFCLQFLSRRSGAVPVRAVSTGRVSCAWSVSCPF